MDYTVNLCDEILTAMRKLGFSEEAIMAIKTNDIFKNVYEANSGTQRSMLSALFFRVLLSARFKTPVEVRLALNIAPDTVGWLDDIKLVILPFILANFDNFEFFKQKNH